MSQNWVFTTLQDYPELAIFITLALGYLVGNFVYKGFSLGAVTGTLLIGILIGQIGIDISGPIKSIFFLMFLFSVGFGIGPQFVRGIANDGVPQAIFAVVICVLCLFGVYIVSKIAGYGIGTTVGLFAGSQTISASIGLATDAINNLDISADAAKQELDAIPVAYAISYLFGTIGTGWIIAFLGPKLLKIDLKTECKRYEEEVLGGNSDVDSKTAWLKYSMKAYQVSVDSIVEGKSVGALEKTGGHTLFIENIRRNGVIITFDEETLLQGGDVVAVSGLTEGLIYWANLYHAKEVADQELLQIPVETVDVLITTKKINGRTIADLANEPVARGVYLTKIQRGATNIQIPIMPKTRLYRGDIVTIIGSQKHIESVTKELGFADRPKTMTDMVFLCSGIFIGGLVGAVVIPLAGLPITLSTSGGVLIAGLLLGWLRSFIPSMGNIPSSTLWFMNSMGLNVFIAIVGITAGPTFISGVKEVGFSLLFWGIFATAMPMVLAPLIGKYIFKFDPAINLGCCGGARTSTASVAMVADAAESDVPMLGYTVPYAVSNTLLTLWGMVIVLLLT